MPPELLDRCDVVVLDPPYLNLHTLREFFVSARLLAKPEKAVGGEGGKHAAPPCIVVTGACGWTRRGFVFFSFVCLEWLSADG